MAGTQSAFTVDGSVFAMRMQQLKSYVGHDLAKQCLPYEAKQFTKSIIRVTPPFGEGGRAKLGRNAVKADIRRTMRPVSSKDFTKNKELRKRIRKLEVAGDNAGLTAVFNAMRGTAFKRSKGVGAFSVQAHTGRRDKRGHVSRNSWPILIVGQQDRVKLAAYVKTMTARVGWHIAGWRTAASATGEQLPPFASRLQAPSAYIAIMDGAKPFISIQNSACSSPIMPAQVRYVMRGREQALASKVSRLIAGKAVNLGFATYLAK